MNLNSADAGPAEAVELLQKQLQDAQRMATLGMLASSVAHEFNNILMTIMNSAKLGLKREDEAERRRALQRILSASERAAQITAGMLGYARNRADERKPVDMIALVGETLILVEKDLSKHQIRLETEFRDRPHAMVAAGQIQQILLNLLINARQAMPRGGTIRLAVRQNHESRMVELVIADTGMGIPRAQIRHIFDPFFTTKAGPDESGRGGTGLGLSVCREIIEAHKGRIRVESRVGQGTTFTVKLPAIEAPHQQVA
jgi:signal transduction histidine kinase